MSFALALCGLAAGLLFPADEASAGSISGSVFVDAAGNAVNDPVDLGLEGVLVTAFDATGAAVGSATSGADGTYTLSRGTRRSTREFPMNLFPFLKSAAASTAGLQSSSSALALSASALGTKQGVDIGPSPIPNVDARSAYTGWRWHPHRARNQPR